MRSFNDVVDLIVGQGPSRVGVAILGLVAVPRRSAVRVLRRLRGCAYSRRGGVEAAEERPRNGQMAVR